MQKKCFNCKWFFSCQREDKDPAKENCMYFETTIIEEVKLIEKTKNGEQEVQS